MASDTAHHTSHSLYKLQSLSRRFILLVAILVGVLTLAPAAQAQEETSAQLSASGQAIVAAINQARANAGLGALAVNPLLNQAAQKHADDMVANYLYSHYGSDGSLVAQRVARTGYGSNPWVSENWVASSSPAGAMAWWMSDYVHRVNILNGNWTEIGVGIATRPSGEIIFVTVFSAGTGGETVVAAAVPAAAPAAASPVQPVPAEGMSYTIQAGDTLLGVALRYGMTWQELAAANGLGEFSLLQIGQVIHIPGSGESASLAATTGVGGPVAEQTLVATRPYTVAAGDTLFAIAARNGMTWQELAALNALGEHSILDIGQVIKLPVKEEAALAAPLVATTVQGTPLALSQTVSVPNATVSNATVSNATVPNATVSNATGSNATVPAQSAPAASAPAPQAVAASVPTAGQVYYTVTTGDTIIGIAVRHNVDWQDVLALNGLAENSLLQPGQVIRLR